MKVFVNGKIEVLSMVSERGIDNVKDFISNWGAIGNGQGQFSYDEVNDAYIADESTFQWWKQAIEREISNNEKIKELSERLGFDFVADAIHTATDGSHDLENIQNAISHALVELEG